MRVPDRAIVVMGPFVVALAALQGASWLVQEYRDALFREWDPGAGRGIAATVRLGSPLLIRLAIAAPPPWTKSIQPIIVHVDCLNCSIIPATVVRDCFAKSDVLNVVVAEEADEYRDIQRQIPSARVVYGDLDLARELGAAFGPRLYVYHSTDGLIYAQSDPTANPLLEVRVHEGG